MSARRRRDQLGSRFSALSYLGLPAAVVGLIGVTALVGPPTPTAAPVTEVPVAESVRACPSSGGWSVATGQVSSGQDTQVTVLGPDGATTGQIDPAAWSVAAPGGETAVVRQLGSGAGGVAFVSGKASNDDGGGLVVSECGGVVDEAWYLGAGAVVRHQSTLVLTNISDVPAVADVEIFGPGGRVDAVENTGIVVNPASTRRIRLEEMAAGEAEMTVRVVRQRGALAASLIDASTAVFAGSELIPAQAGPSRNATITGVVAGGARTLLITNPGETAARVSVEVVGANGAFVPEGLGDLAVAAGTMAVVPVPESAGSDAAVFRLKSDQPIVGAVRMSPGDQDFGYATPTQQWSGPSVIPVSLGGVSSRPVLHFSADEATEVTLEGFDAAMGSIGTVPVTVAAGALASIDLGAGEVLPGDLAYVVATAKSPVRGTAIYRPNDLFAVVPLAPAPVTARAPRVSPDF